MIEIYVGGNRMGTWAEGERLVAELAASGQKFELRDENIRILGKFVPAEPYLFPDRAEIDRRVAAGGGNQFHWAC